MTAELAATIAPILRAGRIPGAAVAVVADNEVIFTQGFGYSDLESRTPVTSQTFYPIASTTKAINATLLGMLVDDGLLEWDAPVREYLPKFRLQDRLIGEWVTLRDLLAMRTGLPRHDFMWLDNPIGREELVGRFAHLPLSSGLRERFQYNNLTPTLAGHVAEVVAGENWEHLIQRRILEPLGMKHTRFEPGSVDVTLSYHENRRREILLTRRLATDPIGPAGGSIHSTVDDMTRWMAFNLNNGVIGNRRLIEAGTLQEIQSPCMIMGADSAAPSPNAAYGLGWFVDTYNGRSRISHTGYLHDVNSCVTLFPEEGIGIVSFVNFASSRLAGLINEHVFDRLTNRAPGRTVDEVLTRYELQIQETDRLNSSIRRVEYTVPSHPLGDYAGRYSHPGYGSIDIRGDGEALLWVRHSLRLPLQHWHFDVWGVAENDLFEIHKPQFFDRANRIAFESSAEGRIASLTIPLEPTVAPARFVKEA